jgi:hypothetical protein
VQTIQWIESMAIALAGLFFLGGLIMQLLLNAVSFIKSRVFGGSPEFGWLLLDWSEIRGWRGAALYPMVLGILLFFIGLAFWLLRQVIQF